MIHIQNKVDCCGCNACGDACVQDAISFKIDNEGFWYPKVDMQKCTDCHLCEKVCPVINADELRKNDYTKPQCVAAIHKNLEVRFDSTSGGLFSAMAEKVYKDGGYVGGAIYTEDWGVKFFISDNLEDLPKLRSSKYLQSNSEGMYKQIRSRLKEGKKVFVCGLPCQIAALKAFLHKDYDNLIMVDLICRYINSPMAYRKYLDTLEKEYGSKVVYIKAKNKELGWRKLTHKVVFKNDKTYYGTIDDDIFMKASMKLNCLSRPSCYECKFKDFPRYGDITIGDYWIDQSKSSLDDNTGTSIVMLNSKKGESFFTEVRKKLKSEDVLFESIVKGNPALYKPLPRSSVSRDDFFQRIQNEDFREVVDSMAADHQKRTSTAKTILKGRLLQCKSIIKTLRTAVRLTQLNPKPLWQFIYLNFIHKAVKGSFLKGNLIFPTPYCVFDIDKDAVIELNGPLSVGHSPFKHSKVETRIKMQRGAKMVIGGYYGFGYGSDIEIFPNAYFESKGGLLTNSFTTIICQEKIVIGKNVACGRNVTLRDNNGGHLISINGYRNSMPIIIGDHVWLTQSVIIMSGVKIGDGTIISAGTLVNSSFPARCVVGGSPARITKHDVYWKM